MRTLLKKPQTEKSMAAPTRASRQLKRLPAISPLQMMYGGSVMQLKVLANDRLNVVGESHSESNKQRDAERMYCYEETGVGNYWNEGDFTVSPESEDPVDTINNRFLQTVKICNNCFQGNIRILNDDYMAAVYDGSFHEKNTTLSEFLEISYVSDVVIYNDSQTIWDRGWIGDVQIPLLFTKIAESVVGLIRSSVNLRVQACTKNEKTGKLILNNETYKSLVDESDMDKQVQHLIALLRIIADVLEHTCNENNLYERDVSKERSQTMHEGANNRFETLGTWKVGNSHAKDMRSMEPKDYNLVDKKTFNAGLEKWKSEKESYANCSIM